MVQVELNNMYINIGANRSSEKLWTKRHCDLIKGLYTVALHSLIEASIITITAKM